MNIYVAYHLAPVPGAPEPVSTFVTPVPADPASIDRACREQITVPIREVRHHVLTYPQMPEDPAVGLALLKDAYKDCGRCHLSEQRTFTAHFRGNPYAKILCMGEGPGRQEDGRGVVFCGPAGAYANELIREQGFDPDMDFGWANLVGCRPCEHRHALDRAPTLVEKLACSERLIMLLRAFRPRVILCFGEQAASAFFAEPPPPNAWSTLQHPDYPRDWVAVAHLRHPSYLLRLGVAVNGYKEVFGQKLFFRALRAWAPTLEKVALWPFVPTYLENPQPVAGKPEPKR